MIDELEFERPVIELRKKIDELKELTKTADVDLSEEIEKLENRLRKLENEIYKNMKPWDRVQIARHPSTTNYTRLYFLLFEDFIEFHGDRYFGDDEAIVGGIAKFKGNL